MKIGLIILSACISNAHMACTKIFWINGASIGNSNQGLIKYVTFSGSTLINLFHWWTTFEVFIFLTNYTSDFAESIFPSYVGCLSHYLSWEQTVSPLIAFGYCCICLVSNTIIKITIDIDYDRLMTKTCDKILLITFLLTQTIGRILPKSWYL